MKSEVVMKTPTPQFNPFELRIAVETLEEALALRALYGADGSVAKAVMMNAKHVSALYGFDVARVYNKAFCCVNNALSDQGILDD